MIIVVLVSGGVDSTISYFLQMQKQGDNKVLPVFVNLRQSYWQKEQNTCKDLFGDALVQLETNAPTNDDKENSFIPNRNLFLASYATLAFNPDIIHISGTADATRPDKSPEIFEEMSALLTKTSDKQITVTSELWPYGKSDAIKMFVNSGVPGAISIMSRTLSCYSDEGKGHCNNCEACFYRWSAMKVNDIDCEQVSDEIIRHCVGIVEAGEMHASGIEDMKKLGLIN